MQALGSGSEVIYLGTTSKTLMLRMRLAWMVVPSDLVAPLSQAQRNLGISVNIHAQAALAEFISSGGYGAHLRKIIRTYSERGHLFAESLSKRFGHCVEVRPPDGGVQLPLVFRSGQDELKSLAALNAAGFSPGRLSALFLEHQLTGLLIGFSQATPERIERFCDVLEDCWQS